MRSISLTLVLAASAAVAGPKPPSLKDIKTQMRDAKAGDHLRVFAVDETCFPAAIDAKSPHGAGTDEQDVGGKRVEQSLTMDGLDKFAAFQTWAQTFATKGHFVGFGLNTLGDTVYGYKAWCLANEPVLAGKDVGFKSNKKVAGIVWSGAVLERLRKLGKDIRRLAVVYGDSEVVQTVHVEDLRASKDAEVGLEIVSF